MLGCGALAGRHQPPVPVALADHVHEGYKPHESRVVYHEQLT